MLAAFSCTLYSQRIPESILKIGLLQNVASFNMSGQGHYYLYEIATGNKTDIAPMNDYLVRGNGTYLELDGKRYASPVRIVSESNEDRLRINGRRYRDNIFISCKEGKIIVINELGIEGYLYGILPCEVDPKWHPESLKAQAVVSRTYALRNLRRHESSGFDLCNQTHCQVFGGVESEDPRTNAAVDATAGEVLTYEGKLAQTLFHASCSGHTENPRYVWNWDNIPPAYLEGRKDKYCLNSPHQSWKNTISADVIRKRLNKAGYKVGAIKSIQLSGKTSSGRTRHVVIKHASGKISVPAAKFRTAVDTWLIKSAKLLKVSRSGNSFRFAGNGWGHGVGMCQWGAKVMAEKEHEYADILEFYYPGTQVEKWEE